MNGGYDDGYEICPCFWGKEPGSLVKKLSLYINDFSGLNILDAGCGEGKNAIHFMRKGATVRALDVSEKAIHNAKLAWPDSSKIFWEVADLRTIDLPSASYDIIIAYGLCHCLSNKLEITDTITKLKKATRLGGYHLVCAFNSRHQELFAHEGFHPILLNHTFYTQLYSDYNTLFSSDEDLKEIHPHNKIEHVHSLSRLIVQKEKK